MVYGPFQQATELYENGKFKEALDLYLPMLDGGQGSVALHQNVGSCYFRLSDNANAILHFEKALRFDPLNNSIKNNIEVVRDQLEDPSPIYDRIFIQEGLFQLMHFLPTILWLILALLLAWASVFFIRKYIFLNSNRKIPFFSAIISLLLAVTCLYFFFGKNAWLAKNDEAILMPESTAVHTAPSEDSQVQFKLSGGSKVVVGEEMDGWTQIHLQNNAKGWVPKGDFQRIAGE